MAKEKRQLVEDSIRAGRLDPRDQEIQRHAVRAIEKLLDEYGEHLSGKGDSVGHIRTLKAFIRECVTVCQAERALDFEPH